MNRRRRRALWLPALAAVGAAWQIFRVSTGHPLSEFNQILWLSIALAWMVIAALGELRTRP